MPSAQVDGHDERAAHRSTWAELSFRLLFSVVFIAAGLGHLIRPAVFVERMLKSPVGQLVAGLAPANLLVVGTGVVLLGAGVGLLLGYRTRVAASALIAVLVPITVSTHLGVAGDPGPLLKNIALLGGLLHFAAAGTAGHSVDRRRRERDAPSVPGS
jgi:putative oxidoreductase